MFLVFIAAAAAGCKLIDLTNRVLEEYVIPAKSLTKVQENKDKLVPVALDMALTIAEMERLDSSGAIDIIQRGSQRHADIQAAGHAHTCNECGRLDPRQA